MKRYLICSIDLQPKLKSEQSVIVEYFRTEEEEPDECCDKSKPFGIEVVKRQNIDGVTYREIKSVKNIGRSTEIVDNILELLRKNSVTPISVSDILEDLSII